MYTRGAPAADGPWATAHATTAVDVAARATKAEDIAARAGKGEGETVLPGEELQRTGIGLKPWPVDSIIASLTADNLVFGVNLPQNPGLKVSGDWNRAGAKPNEGISRKPGKYLVSRCTNGPVLQGSGGQQPAPLFSTETATYCTARGR